MFSWRKPAIAALAGITLAPSALAICALAVAAPAAAQFYSDGYRFLEAVKKKDGETATSLLDEPGSTVVNSRDLTTGETGLHLTIAQRDLLWTQFLLQRKANPNIKDNKGMTPLMLAVQLGFLDGVETLVNKGAQVDVANRAGETPLITAVHRRDTELMRILLEAGADPDQTDNSGRSARDYASLPGVGSVVLGEIERSAKSAEERAASRSYGPSL
jgi:ankyrin repeat protein